MKRIFGLLLITLCVTSCSTPSPTANNDQAAVCKELKRRIIFNGATGNNTEATQQRGELTRLNTNYTKQGC